VLDDKPFKPPKRVLRYASGVYDGVTGERLEGRSRMIVVAGKLLLSDVISSWAEKILERGCTSVRTDFGRKSARKG